MISLVLVSTWANLGGATLMYLAALQGIQGELYEAAELDGASVWQRLRHVTLPQLRFIMLVLLLLQIIATMQVFIEPFALTGTSNPDTITVLVLDLPLRLHGQPGLRPGGGDEHAALRGAGRLLGAVSAADPDRGLREIPMTLTAPPQPPISGVTPAPAPSPPRHAGRPPPARPPGP